MPITQVAEAYLSSLSDGASIEGGLAFESYIDKARLDFSVESLKYIDTLLDAIHSREQPSWDDSLESDQSKVNFSYLLSFYVGKVIERATSESVTWYQYQEIVDSNPSLSSVIEHCFGTSIMCTHGGALYIPLSAILTRLTEGPEEKSVWYSATGQIEKLKPLAKPAAGSQAVTPTLSKPKPWYKIW